MRRKLKYPAFIDLLRSFHLRYKIRQYEVRLVQPYILLNIKGRKIMDYLTRNLDSAFTPPEVEETESTKEGERETVASTPKVCSN